MPDPDRPRGPAREPSRGPELARELADAARALRADVPLRPEWRDAVMREVEALPPFEPAAPRPRGSRLVLHPLAGLAAALALVALGAVGGRLLLPRDGGRASVAQGDAQGDAAPGAPAATTVRFVLVAPGARRVALVGDFNRWNADATPMRASGDGRTWLVQVPLAPGRHLYAFMVDGDLVADPAAPRAAEDDFGIPNSVVLVTRPQT